MTPEERKVMKDKVDAEKAEWMKKNKKKPKSADEEAQDLANAKLKVEDALKNRCVTADAVIGQIENFVND